jgi:hypothetical protein
VFISKKLGGLGPEIAKDESVEIKEADDKVRYNWEKIEPSTGVNRIVHIHQVKACSCFNSNFLSFATTGRAA